MFNDVLSNSDYTASSNWMTEWIGMDGGVACFKLYLNLLEELRKTTKPELRILIVLAEDQTGDFPNAISLFKYE